MIDMQESLTFKKGAKEENMSVANFLLLLVTPLIIFLFKTRKGSRKLWYIWNQIAKEWHILISSTVLLTHANLALFPLHAINILSCTHPLEPCSHGFYIEDAEYSKYKFHRIWQKVISKSFHPSYRTDKISKGLLLSWE